MATQKKRVGNGELDQKNSDFATHLHSYIEILAQTQGDSRVAYSSEFRGYRTLVRLDYGEKVRKEGTNVRNQALDMLLPIGLGTTVEEKVQDMLETTVDYWTCIDLAEALEQTMRNDLWSTAERIAETATRITNKPEELVSALSKFNVRKAALDAAEGVADTTITTTSQGTNHFSKAG